MIEILKDYDLTKLNTFGISAKARFFVEIKKERDLIELFQTSEFRENEKLFLGGGSNILFTKDFDGIVILNKIKGIEILPARNAEGIASAGGEEDPENIWIKSMGGEGWNDLVNFAVEHEYWGIENLTLVPGTVGATPVQNIGAYGVELKDTLESVEAYEVTTGKKKIFSCPECEFGYRDSVFKQGLKGKYFISAIVLKLNKKPKPNVSYKILKDYLAKSNLDSEDIKDISNAVAEIRRSKLPDPRVIGNAGSFFKNVFVEKSKLEELKKTYPEIPSFEEGENIKIPAGWLIEQCGPRHGGASWKGKRVGNVGVHDKQALVLVNHGGATGEEIKNLAFTIIDSVYQKFGLKLTPEVNLI